jgi:hypothetical protein
MKVTHRPDELGLSGSDVGLAVGLDHAEALLAAVDRARLQLSLFRMWQLIAFALITSSLIFAIGDGQASGFAGRPILILIATAAGAGLLGLEPAARQCIRRRARDERAMLEIVDSLRELLPLISYENDSWSPTVVSRVMRSRVSRFPIVAGRNQ